MIRFYWFILGILCVWRITHLLQAEDGPGNIIIRVRRAVGNGFWGELLDCFYCLSLWISAPFAYILGETLTEQLLLWPALSAGAILVDVRDSASFEPLGERSQKGGVRSGVDPHILRTAK